MTRVRRLLPVLGVVPFTLFVGIFLLWPTWIVVSGALTGDNGGFSLSALTTVLTASERRTAFLRSIELSAVTALAGAVFGALVSWVIAGSAGRGTLRRVVLAAAGVFAQFGGVMLAFAFLATFGFTGMATLGLAKLFGDGFWTDASWIYSLPGLCVVYTFFQIPLMVIVFTPAVDNLRAQWREASDTLGGTAGEFWRYVGLPVLAPSFLGSALLLFANAFSAYATAAALISQGSSLVPLQIRSALSGEVLLRQASLGKALALGMIIVVAVVMAGYTLMQRRVARWSR